MPQGDKRKYTDKQKRQAEHIEEGYEEKGLSKEEAERRAWATVNKVHGGGEALLPTEDRLRKHRVHAFRRIHDLRHVKVRGERAQHVGLVAGHLVFGDQKVHHLAGGQPGGLVEIGIESHRDVVGRRLGARPAQALSFSHAQLERPPE